MIIKFLWKMKIKTQIIVKKNKAEVSLAIQD
jgi:hypothetical protein